MLGVQEKAHSSSRSASEAAYQKDLCLIVFHHKQHVGRRFRYRFPNTGSYIIIVLSKPGDSARVRIAIYLPNPPFTTAHHKPRVVEEAFNNVPFKP